MDCCLQSMGRTQAEFSLVMKFKPINQITLRIFGRGDFEFNQQPIYAVNEKNKTNQ